MHLRVNRFTFAEWPVQPLAPFANLSIGEEQSESRAVMLAWSPPGLAKHGRCVLAVLTSNLLLSVWASPSDPADERSWRRILIVNDVLANYFEQWGKGGGGPKRDTPMLRSKRVRAAAWAPRYSFAEPDDLFGPDSALLSVLNDASELVLLRCHYDSAGSGKLDATAIRCLQLHQPIPRHIDGSLDKITWSTWSKTADGERATVRCRQMGSTATVQVVAKMGEYEELLILASQRVESPDESDEAVPAHEKIDASTQEQLERAHRRITRRFSNKHGLEGKVATRLWGFCDSRDLVATSISVHPSEQIEYTPPAKERSYLLFAADALEQARNFPWETENHHNDLLQAHLKPWELLLNFLRQLSTAEDTERHLKEAEPATESTQAIEDGVGQSNGSPERWILSTEMPDREFVFTSLCAVLLLRPEWLSGLSLKNHIKIRLDKTMNGVLDLANQLEGGLQEAAMERLNDLVDACRHEATTTRSTTCQICDEVLLWKSIYAARCKTGHSFGTYYQAGEVSLG